MLCLIFLCNNTKHCKSLLTFTGHKWPLLLLFLSSPPTAVCFPLDAVFHQRQWTLEEGKKRGSEKADIKTCSNNEPRHIFLTFLSGFEVMIEALYFLSKTWFSHILWKTWDDMMILLTLLFAQMMNSCYFIDSIPNNTWHYMLALLNLQWFKSNTNSCDSLNQNDHSLVQLMNILFYFHIIIIV